LQEKFDPRRKEPDPAVGVVANVRMLEQAMGGNNANVSRRKGAASVLNNH
jgi:hypothetical protein